MKDPMLDQDFLRELDHWQHHHIWAKIISLNFDEEPLEEITGRITGGNINIDGTSTVRRTCSLTMVSDQVKITDLFWGLRTKFSLFIGLENFINPEYDDIIWFKQGVFFITSFNTSAGTNNFTISIQGKDKMALLNGDMGGVIPSSWDFATENVTEKDDDGNPYIQTNRIPIKNIILEAVHEFAQEPWQNIIVNDLDDFGIELLEYQGTTPFYYIIDKKASGVNNSREVHQLTFNQDMLCNVELVDWRDDTAVQVGQLSGVKISELDSNRITEAAHAAGASNPPVYSYEKLIEQLDPSGNVTETNLYYRTTISFPDDLDEDGNPNLYTVAKITRDNGMQVCGYRICDIIYPYDLIASPGESVTSVLDKLVKMLGNFEYFYDVDGRFTFQKKRTYLDVSYNNIINEHSINQEVWANSSEYSSKYSYNFDKSTLISSIQNSPNISNLKNDFSLWGARRSGDITVPIHLRYAIDHKPWAYRTFDTYDSKTGELVETGKWYMSEDGWDKYNQAIDDFEKDEISTDFWQSKIEVLRADYPPAMNNPKSSLYDWWKLRDWVTLFESFIGEIPEKTRMSWGDQTILDTNYYDTIESLLEVFNGNASPTQRVSIVDVDMRDLSIVYTGHGYNGCSHTYKQLLDKSDYIGREELRENIEIWIYDPRLWDKRKIKEDSTSILTPDAMDNMVEKILFSSISFVDWREIIFRMAKDYRRHYHEPDFLTTLRDNNYLSPNMYSLYPTGYTGYEKYYVDFEMNMSQGVVAYWRELYNPDMINDEGINYTGRYLPDGSFDVDDEVEEYDASKIYDKDERAYVLEGNEGNKERVIYRSLKNDNQNPPKATSVSWVRSQGEFTYNSDGWNINIMNNPEVLNFWFDFLDTLGEFNRYSVHNIGLRSKATNDDKIKAIYFREVPNVIFDVDEETTQLKREENWTKPGYCYVNIPTGVNDLFTISTRGKNAMDVVEEYLYAYTYSASSVNINSIPIYYLQPNTLIYIDDSETGIVGEYIMQKMSIQLGTSPQMSINAVETAKRLY